MKIIPAIMAGSLLLTPAILTAQQATPPAAGAAATDSAAVAVTEPAEFAAKATSSNMFEIESSQMALEKAQRDEVKEFAQRMVDDHTKAGEDMKAALEAEAVTAPTEMAEAEQAKIEELNAAADFDAAYVTAQTEAHDQAVALFQGYVDGGPDGALKDFAAATLPTLQEHQTMAHDLSGM